MTKARSVSRELRTLLLGTAAVVLILAIGRAAPAWRSWQSDVRLRAAVNGAELARARASVRDTAALRDTLAQRKARLAALTPALLSGRTPSAAAGALASLVSDAATTAGMRVASIQLRIDTARVKGQVRVAVRAELVGDIRGLSEMLTELEGGQLLLAIRELEVSQPEPVAPPDRAEALRVQLFVEGMAARIAATEEGG